MCLYSRGGVPRPSLPVVPKSAVSDPTLQNLKTYQDSISRILALSLVDRAPSRVQVLDGYPSYTDRRDYGDALGQGVVAARQPTHLLADQSVLCVHFRV